MISIITIELNKLNNEIFENEVKNDPKTTEPVYIITDKSF